MTEPVMLLAGLKTGAWLDAQVFDPLAYAVPGVIPEGSTLLVGPPKIGKSWFVLSMSLAVASGGRALGCLKVQQRPVLYLALEDGDRRLQDRCRKLLDDDPIPHAFHYLTRIEPGSVVATIGQWVEAHGGQAPLVVLDTLGKVMPAASIGESAYQRDYRVGTSLKRVVDANPGMSLVVNHHDRKAESADFVDSVSGTHGLAGAADTVLVLVRSRQSEDGTLKVTGRDVVENEYALTFTDTTWQLAGSSLDAAATTAATARASAGVGDRSVAVVALVTQQHNTGTRAQDVADALGIDNKTAGVYLSRLAAAGRIDKAARGLYLPARGVVSVVLPGPWPDQTQQPTDTTPPLGDGAA